MARLMSQPWCKDSGLLCTVDSGSQPACLPGLDLLPVQACRRLTPDSVQAHGLRVQLCDAGESCCHRCCGGGGAPQAEAGSSGGRLVLQNGGLDTEEDYKYIAEEEKCSVRRSALPSASHMHHLLHSFRVLWLSCRRIKPVCVPCSLPQASLT